MMYWCMSWSWPTKYAYVRVCVVHPLRMWDVMMMLLMALGEGFPKCAQPHISLNEREAPAVEVPTATIIIQNCTATPTTTPKPNNMQLNSNLDTGRTTNSLSDLFNSKNPISCLNGPTANPTFLSNHSLDSIDLKTILAITPTYKRPTQKLDLMSLCHTIMHIPNFLWIVIEDAKEKSDLVSRLLKKCRVNSVHLNAPTSKMTKRARQRGVEQRNTGLDWIRKFCKDHCASHCNAVVYFMDDDNKYDLRLFYEVKGQLWFSTGMPYQILSLLTVYVACIESIQFHTYVH